jgi:DNA invertase Pin-like site-specific DNA recombinase
MTGSRGICHAAPFMNGVIYCRVSSDEQVKGTSLESQEAACKEYAESHRINILRVFVERGESAKFADRTQLLELIDFCRKNRDTVEVLLVWKVDRFARNVTDHFSVKATLAKYGVRIVSVTEPIDTNPEGKLMETILAGFAQFDNDIRAMRTVQGMRRKLQEGIFPWKPPLGYKTPTKNGEKKTKPDQPVPGLFSGLQRAWREFATGAYTKAEIRRMMTSWGVLTEKGCPLSPQSVDNLFSNPYYAGILLDAWSGEEYQGKHVPMVSREEFARVQQITAGRNRSIPHRRDRPEFPLKGLIRCHRCLHYLTAGLSRGRSQRYAYYRCSRQECDPKSYPAGSLHIEFSALLDNIAPRPGIVEMLGELVIRTAKDRHASLKARNFRRKEGLEQVLKQIRELIGMRAQGLITDQEFIEQKTGLAERRAAIEGRAAEMTIDPEQVRQELVEITGPLTELRQTWETLRSPYCQRFKHLVFPVGFVNGKTGTAELGLLFQVFRRLSDRKSHEVSLVGKLWNRILCEIREFSALSRACRGAEEASPNAVPANSKE